MVGGRLDREGIYVYVQLTHAVVQQKPTQHYNAIMCSVASVLSLCDPVDCRLPGSAVHGVLLARIPVQAAMPSSKNAIILQLKINF